MFEEMTLLEHMEELRDRIVKIVVSIAVAFIAGFFLADPLLQKMADQSNVSADGFDIGSPTDTITVYMKVAIYIAIGFAMPIIIYHLVGFLAPGLTRKEKRILFASLPFVSFLFLGGAGYAFFGAAPAALTFLSNWKSGIFSWDPDGSQVIGFYLTLMVGLGLAFQLPVVMFLLAKLNIVSPKRMRQYRKYAALVILVISAIITPTTDPINLALVAVPLLLLYELGIIVSFFFARGNKAPATP
ncbi:MAG: twin-arginine translocase subunit TatC [Chloroflexota bacterium]|nr:twin-arginine translocase subunit TatC [Chloroflexota bacterium]